MLRLLLPLSALVACTPSPRKAVMPTIPEDAVQQSGATAPQASAAALPEPAAQGPSPAPVSAAGIAAQAAQADSPAAAAPADSPAAALGRRTLSTAFVRIGPDGHLTVELHGGRVLVLRDVIMRPADYCGVRRSGERYCGAYAEIAAARPGGAPAAGAADPGVGTRATPMP